MGVDYKQPEETLFSVRGLSCFCGEAFWMRGWRHKRLTVWSNYNSSGNIKGHCVLPRHLTLPIMHLC